MSNRSEAHQGFEDDVRAAAQRRNSATVDISDKEVSAAAKGFNAWIRGEGAPAASEHTDDIADAAKPTDAPSEAGEAFARWAGAAPDDDEE